MAGALNGLVPSTFNWYVGSIVLAGLFFGLPAIALLQNKLPPRPVAWLYFVASHIIAGLSLIYIAGVDNPFTSLWVVMLVISYLELGWGAFALSSLTLAIAMVIARQISPEIADDKRFALSVVGCIVTVFLTVFAFVIARIVGKERQSRRDLEKSREQERVEFNKLDTVINSLNDIIVTIDTNALITTQNAAALDFFNTNRSLIGQRLEEILPLVTVNKEKIDLGTLLRYEGGMERDDLIKITPDGEEIRLSMQLRPIAESYTAKTQPGFVVILRDITKQKTLEEEKDEFISVASHELRTPIAIAEGSLGNLMLLQERGVDTETLKASTKEAHNQVMYLAGIVNDLSTLSRTERSEELPIEQIDTKLLLKGIYDKYLSEAKVKKIAFKLDVDENIPSIVTTRLYLEEILQNFMTNALKYTAEGSITIMAKQRDSAVILSVIDTGIGISKSDQAKIFEKFYRSEDFHTRETSGTGLGLYIVRRLAEKIHSKIEVESHLGEGSTFSLELPTSFEEKA